MMMWLHSLMEQPSDKDRIWAPSLVVLILQNICVDSFCNAILIKFVSLLISIFQQIDLLLWRFDGSQFRKDPARHPKWTTLGCCDQRMEHVGHEGE